MDKVYVRVYNSGTYPLPRYETQGAAGVDLYARDAVDIPANSTKLVPTGLFVEVPEGFEIQVRPRSGLSLKTGLRVANSPGTVDSDYRGEVCVLMWNTTNVPIQICVGDRIAQAALQVAPQLVWVEVNTKEELSSTARGAGGFGSTGK